MTEVRALVWACRLFPVALLPLMLVLSRDFGFTWDEKTQQLYGERVWRFLTEGLDDDWFRPGENLVLYLYGGLFDTICVALQRVLSAEGWVTRHYVNAAFGWLGILYLGRLGRLLAGPGTGLLAMVLLTLSPRLPDAPFAEPSVPRLAARRAPGAIDRPGDQRQGGGPRLSGIPGARPGGTDDREARALHTAARRHARALARRECVDQDQAVPVVGGADDDRVDFLVVEQLPVVAVQPGRLAARLFGVNSTAVEDLLVDVGERHALDPLRLQGGAHVGPALPLQPMTPKRTRSLGATTLVSAAASRPGARPAPIAASDEPLMMKCRRDSFMSIHLARSQQEGSMPAAR
jgi:hypothetical protein